MKQNFLSKFSSALSKKISRVHLSEPWYIQKQRHIQNPGIFRALAYSEHEAYSEAYQTSTMEHFAKLVHSHIYICKLQLFLQYYLFKFSTL